MSKLRVVSYELGVMALSLLFSVNTSAATLVRQCGAVGIVTYDDPPITETQMTPVPVPNEELLAHDPEVVDEHVAYEASADASVANGCKVWECYGLGLDDLSDPLDDFLIAMFWMDGDMSVFDFNHTEDDSDNSILPPEGDSIVDTTPDGVQLWENGPYWAECNVGAAKPEEYGYYFWWGDTVGYTNTGSGWISVEDGTGISFRSSGTAASTYGKDNATLLSAGYIDETGNLVAAYDAATAHLGSPWRMPTDAEFSALISNCTTTWITTNGVSGRLVTGKGDYADRSIFLPAAGYGYDTSLYFAVSRGYYWSSTPNLDNSNFAWYLYFDLGNFYRNLFSRYFGQSVRPVRRFAQ